MKVLFLDIDGVLNHAGWRPNGKRRRFDPEACDQLERVVRETDARIVVSSSWRLGEDLASLKDRLFSCGLGCVDRIIDMTPSLGGSRVKDATGALVYRDRRRGDEIAAWLREAHVTSYVIVDDDDDVLDEQQTRFVQTSWDRGFQATHADRAIRILLTPQ